MGHSPHYTRSSGDGQYQQHLAQEDGRPASFPGSSANTQPNMAATVQNSHFNNHFGAPVPLYSTSNASYVPIASTSSYKYDTVSQQNPSSLQSSSSSFTFPAPNYLPNFPLSMSSLEDLRPQALALSLAGPQATLTMTGQQDGSNQSVLPSRNSRPNTAMPVAFPSSRNEQSSTLCVSPKLIMTAPSSVGYSRSSSRGQSPSSSPLALDSTVESGGLRHSAGHTEKSFAYESTYASSSGTSSPLVNANAPRVLSTNAKSYDTYMGPPLSTINTPPAYAASSYSSGQNGQIGLSSSGIYNSSSAAQYSTSPAATWQLQSSAGTSQRRFQPENTAYIAPPGATFHRPYAIPNGHHPVYQRSSSSYTLPPSSTETTFRYTTYPDGQPIKSPHPAAGLPQLSAGVPPYFGLQDGQRPSSEPANAAISHSQTLPILPSPGLHPSPGASATPSVFYTGHYAHSTAGLGPVDPSCTSAMRTFPANGSMNCMANMQPRRSVTTPGPSLAYAPYLTGGTNGLAPMPEYESQRMLYTRSSTMSAHSPVITPRRAVSAYDLHDLSQYGPDSRSYGTKTRLNKQGLIHSSDVENAYPGEWGDAFR